MLKRKLSSSHLFLQGKLILPEDVAGPETGPQSVCSPCHLLGPGIGKELTKKRSSNKNCDASLAGVDDYLIQLPSHAFT